MSNTNTELMNKQKKGLGRGLGSLLGGSPGGSLSSSANINIAEGQQVPPKEVNPNGAKLTTGVEPLSTQAPALNIQTAASDKSMSTQPIISTVSEESRIWKVEISKLRSGEYQPRQTFEKEAMAELAQSIKENGILQPIVARKTQSGLEIIAGERRWRAAQAAGLHEVPVIIKDFDDRKALEMAIIENVQREDLNPIEEAEGYARLITEFNLSQQAVAEKVGKERATVANAVRLLQLPIVVREMVAKNDLAPGHAKVLLGLTDSVKIIELARQVVAEKIPVRRLEKLVAEIHSGKASQAQDSQKQRTAEKLIASISEELQRKLGTKVNIDYREGKGKISISFYSDDELNNLIEKFKST